ncbi:class I SAM-dependent methyltransferase [uncultured Nostoc sp.]|uniref:class I SAM-dependent methyltransferase n=1 Tax=uncultured Nostoc sp. TaxID=340711 RepID=UPI0035C9CAE8
MNESTLLYDKSFFNSKYFQTDYKTIATTIFNLYQPKTVADFGCGPGHLSRELAKLGVKVTAIDGFSQPDFSNLNVEFHLVNLNDSIAITNIFTNRTFDMAICLEVAEHLNPSVSSELVTWLTKVAPVVVFSAAVLGQGGVGHINLQPRDFWHGQFTQHSFLCADRIREQLRLVPSIAPWYLYNILDYVHTHHPLVPQAEDVIQRLIASESAATSAYFGLWR